MHERTRFTAVLDTMKMAVRVIMETRKLRERGAGDAADAAVSAVGGHR